MTMISIHIFVDVDIRCNLESVPRHKLIKHIIKNDNKGDEGLKFIKKSKIEVAKNRF